MELRPDIMRVEILCITFSRDRVFLQALLASIQKFASGFAAVHVIVPTHEFRLFHEFVPDWVKLASYREEPGKGMLQHEAEIIRADFWCPKADAILHVDADCVFTQPVSPSDYLNLYRPILYREKFEEFRSTHPTRYGWQAVVQSALGFTPEWETMVRHPTLHLPEVYRLTRRLISARHEDFYRYILSCEHDFPQGFAEFPTLGAVAISFLAERYYFVDHLGAGRDYPYRLERDKLIAFWSHGGPDAVCDRDMDFPGGNTLGQTPRQVWKALGL